MKKKGYIRLSVLCFLLSIAVGVYGLFFIGLFNPDKVLIRAQVCDCPDYEVIAGSFKLARQMPDSLPQTNATEIFLAGLPNPFSRDFTKTYDCFLITGRVTGVRQLHPGQPWNPVFSVTAWEHPNLGLLWLLVIPAGLLLYLTFRFRRKFVLANRPSMLEVSLMAYDREPPDA
ncbi:MAG TPA: hypothetical protein VG870_04095 [Chitinophagaceae bacterium]|nr:hypothetical protein [Chitinophagaceae bacterium]